MISKTVFIENKLACVSIFWEVFFKLQELHWSNIHALIDTPALPKISLPFASDKDHRQRTRCRNYVENVVLSYNLDEFQHHFRLERCSFELILRHIGNFPEYTNKISPGRPKIPLDKVLLMTLWYLGNQ